MNMSAEQTNRSADMKQIESFVTSLIRLATLDTRDIAHSQAVPQ